MVGQSTHSLQMSLLKKSWKKICMLGSGLAFSYSLLSGAALAQITTDNTTPTVLGPSASGCAGTCITGGLRDGNGSGTNVFHSFSDFNIGIRATVTFDNAAGVTNIFSRVTGPSATTIDGRLSVNGPANLFLLNPQGILFQENAQLNIPGSFLSTTAQSIQFQNNTEFNADINSTLPSLLNVSVPIGVQFGTNPADIDIQGPGHSYTSLSGIAVNSFFGPIRRQLSLRNQQTLAFLGGNVNLQGAILISQEGHVEVGSVGDNGSVAFDPSSANWNFDYSGSNTFGDINLSARSGIDVGGLDAGSIQLQGRNIALSEGSTILAQFLSSGSGNITLNATDSISLAENPDAATSAVPTSVFINSIPFRNPSADGSSLLTVNASNLSLSGGAQFGMNHSSPGALGAMNINAQTITLDGGREQSASGFSARVTSAQRNPGQGADINITTNDLRLTNGGLIIADTFGAASSGNISITPHATSPMEPSVIEVDGFSEFGPSQITSSSSLTPNPSAPNGSGNSGNITLATQQLRVADGGQIGVRTLSNNSAGRLLVQASESVELNGQVAEGRSGLFASSVVGSGAGGDIIVETPQLSLLNGATINASNFPSTEGLTPGSGPAGNIEVSGVDGLRNNSIELKDGSLITASTVSGDRSNITLESERLVLRRGSDITTNAIGTATGGNINLTTTALVALEDSDITANAEDNFGGRVVVNAQTILGTAYREQLTAESDITASSALGPAFSGSVEINNPQGSPTDGLEELPEGLVSEQQIVAACEQLENNTFVATGRGGLPVDASQIAVGESIWTDFRFSESAIASPVAKNESVEPIQLSAEKPDLVESSVDEAFLVEAQTWARDREGQVVLGNHHIAAVSPQLLAQCAAQ